LSEVEGISVDENGNLLIADTSNHRIRRVDEKGVITTVAGTGKTGHSGDGGPATAATFHDPVSVVADSDGLYISDHHNDRVRRIDHNGTIATFAGTGVRGFSGDGDPATSAMLNQPWALAVCNGTLYITTLSTIVSGQYGSRTDEQLALPVTRSHQEHERPRSTVQGNYAPRRLAAGRVRGPRRRRRARRGVRR
jgi:hypothetical protein